MLKIIHEKQAHLQFNAYLKGKEEFAMKEREENRIEEFKINDAWRLQKYLAEFINAYDRLHDLETEKVVTIFGSARTNPRNEYYRITRRLARIFSSNGYTVVTGGGGGIMEAANRGAADVNGKSVGLNIILPHEQKPNKYSNIKKDFKYFFIRKLFLVRSTDVFIVMPGGFGSMDELFEVLTLIQTKRMKKSPIILVDTAYWQGLVDWMKSSFLKSKNISPEDMDLFKLMDDPEEVFNFANACNSK